MSTQRTRGTPQGKPGRADHETHITASGAYDGSALLKFLEGFATSSETTGTATALNRSSGSGDAPKAVIHALWFWYESPAPYYAG